MRATERRNPVTRLARLAMAIVRLLASSRRVDRSLFSTGWAAAAAAPPARFNPSSVSVPFGRCPVSEPFGRWVSDRGR